MPVENKKWTINFIDLRGLGRDTVDDLNGGWEKMLRYKITPPGSNELRCNVYFTEELVEDHRDFWSDDLFKKCALVKIEEIINEGSLEEIKKIGIYSRDFKWAEKIKKGQIVQSSHKESENNYVYFPERKIVGFGKHS